MNRILLILTFFPLVVFAQTPFSGIVIDASTKRPIADVIVQYGPSFKDYIYTNASGIFSIPLLLDSTIHLQSIGYRTKSLDVRKMNLASRLMVSLEVNPVSLKPVVISAVDADKLLEEAMESTKKHLLQNMPVGYLLHFLQTKSSDTTRNEIYLKYTSILDSKELKKTKLKDRIPYQFNLIDVRRLQKTFTPTSELYGAEYHASHLFTFGESANNKTTRSYDSDSTVLALDIEPLQSKGGWAKGSIKIRLDSMTLLSMEIESVDSILQSQPYKMYMGKQIKIVSKKGRFSFVWRNGVYYMNECYTYYKFRVIDELGKEDEVSYYCDVNSLGVTKKGQIKNRKLGGYCQELFYLPTSTMNEFWLYNYDEEEEKELIKHYGMAPSVNKNFKYALKKLYYFIPFVIGTYFLSK